VCLLNLNASKLTLVDRRSTSCARAGANAEDAVNHAFFDNLVGKVTEILTWVRGHWTDALKRPGFSMGCNGRIPGVCLCRSGVGDRIGDREYLLGY
jgi:hypothetical protein